MSAFEVALTPPRIKNARNNSAAREPTQVVLGLFSAKSIVMFEDIPVTKSARRILHIHNPTDDILKVLVTKSIKPEANATLEWTSNEIPGRGYISMEIIWNPLNVWSTREIIQFTDNRNFKKDVAVILKSIDKSQSKNLLKKSLGIKHQTERLMTKKLTLKSPSPRSKQRMRMSALVNKNSGAIRKKTIASDAINIRESQEQSKRVLGSLNQMCGPQTIHYLDVSEISMSTEKENLRPSTPKNVSSIFETFNFTPVTQTKINRSNVDYLASMPTPSSNIKSTTHRPIIISKSPQSNGSPVRQYNGFNATATIESTPSTALNDQTRILCDLQTPRDYTETNTSQTYEYITQYSEATPGIRVHETITTTKYNYSFHQSMTKSPNNKSNPVEIPIQGRKLVLDSIGLSPRMEKIPEDETQSFTNRTQILSSPVVHPQLSIIEEEYSKVELSQTYATPNEHQLTYNVVKTPENLARDVILVGTPLHKKYQSMKELGNSNNNLSLEQRILKSNQGSMPNLHKFDKVKPFENNRYFYQSIEKDLPETNDMEILTENENEHEHEIEHENLGDTSICSMKSTVSTQSVGFKEHEILAQSSRFNLNEIGKHRIKPTYFCVDKPTNESGNHRPNRNLSVSSPTVNKVTPNQKLSQSTRDIKTVSSTFSRPSVISYVNGSNATPCQKRIRDYNFDQSRKSQNKQHSPPKRVCMDSSPSPQLSKGQSFRTNTWGGVLPKKFRIPSVPAQKLLLKRQPEERVILFDPDLHMRAVINPDPFAATTTFDPFLAATMYLDDRAVDKHEIQFKKWLNALVTIPGDIAETNQQIDVGKLFNEVRNKDITLAPTKEMVSSNYLTKYRMDSLRSAAINLFTSNEMRESLEKLMVHIEKRAIQIRLDRNLHLDVVLQRQILELLLNINPIWLRIGLEVAFGELIPMHSNQDVISLSSFILNRLFRDRYLEAKHPKVYSHGEAYAEHIKKFTLKKVLCLFYFLDVAKNKKIIKHNPCLFLKTSEFKETKDILLRFSSSLLGNVGDIQRDLRRIGIVLTHKQTYIDEFDYAFRNLAIDLRDGVRLTKVMEIILLRDDLTSQLRVPAISRTQRVHNVGVALKALQETDFNLTGKITAADIADGHREKTLSLLWQIIYQFRAPKFNAAAAVIQNWWHKKWLSVCIRRRIRAKIEATRHNAARIIQTAYRGYRDRKYAKLYLEQRTQAAITIQRYARRYIAIKQFNWKLNCIVFIQRWYRNQRLAQMVHQQYVLVRKQTTVIQRWYRKILLARKIESIIPVIRKIQHESQKTYKSAVIIQNRFRAFVMMKRERTKYLNLKQATVTIQRHLKATLEMREQRQKYVETRMHIVHIQQFYRARILMQTKRTKFLQMKSAACQIQGWFRACTLAKKQRQRYHIVRRATISLQRRFRALKQMRLDQQRFQIIKTAVIQIQHRFRATKMMKIEQMNYKCFRKATICVQQHYRAMILMREQRTKYVALQSSVICIQQRYRANKLAELHREQFKLLKKSVICIQQHYRSKQLMLQQRSIYLNIQQNVILIQRKFRATLLMRNIRNDYLNVVKHTIIIQRKFRANKLKAIYQSEYKLVQQSVRIIQCRFRAQQMMRKQRNEFKQLKSAAIVIQTRFRAAVLARRTQWEYIIYKSKIISIQVHLRATLKMRAQRIEYQKTKKAAITIQRRFIANQLMKIESQKYIKLRSAAIVLQNRYRAKRLMETERANFQLIKHSAIVIQRRLRANQLMVQQRNSFLILKQSCVTIQIHYRAQLSMRCERRSFELLRKNTIIIQRRFRANVLTKQTQSRYKQLLNATRIIQRRFRAKLLTQQRSQEYKELRWATIQIQRQFRANILQKQQQNQFDKLKWATIVFQRRFRAQRQMKLQTEIFTQLKVSVISVQRRFKALISMRKQRTEFLRLKSATICVQQHLRATLLMRHQRKEYLLQKSSVTYIQQRYRALIEMRHQRVSYLIGRRSIITIQRFVRSYQAMKKQRLHYLSIRAATCTIQQRFIAYRSMVQEKQNYLNKRAAAIKIQTFFRSYLLMKSERKHFLNIRQAAVAIQKRYRANRTMQKTRSEYLQLRKSVLCVQQRFRANLLMKKLSNQYKLVRCLVVCIQQKFRANRLMRKERKEFIRIRNAACTIQQRYRAKLMMQHEQQHYLNLRKTTVALQSCIRGYLARNQFKLLMTPELIQKRREIKAAKKIQSFWRGYRIRKTRTPLLRRICEKSKQLQLNVCQQNTVRCRVQGIIRFLKQRFNANDALSILKELESISRTIPHTLIGDSKFIAHFCYAIMSQAIRSEVDKQLISLCCRVLLNLARYKPTQQNVFQIDYFETVAQILSRWSDKDCDIFNVLCTVLYVFIENQTMNQQIRDFMITREAIFLLRESKKMVARKERMRMNNPLPWMPVLTVKEKRTLPMIETNYGVKSAAKNYIFNCSVFAFDTILSKMNIQI